jgi:ABC-2 type transport system permease protein
MNKTLAILRHEFVTTVTRKGFITMAIIFPLIGFAAIGIFQLTQIAAKPAEEIEIPQIGYIDEAGEFTDFAGDFENIKLIPYAEQDAATKALVAGEIDEYFVIPDDYLETGLILRYHIQKELEMSGETYAAIRAFLQENLLKGQTSPQISERVINPINVQSIRLDEAGQVAADQGGFEAFLIPMLFGFLLVISIGASSGYLLQGLGEEKENRVMEILLSSVTTRQLLIGKVLGLGGAGLIQVAFWLVSSVVMLRVASTTIGGFFASVQIPQNAILLGIVYYVLGYLLFAVIMAGIGAITSNPKEGSQMSVLLILPAILPFYVAIIFLRDHPDHVIGTIMTLFPVTAPMSVFVRMGLSEIAPWEIITSIGILILSILGGLWLAAKAFRVFLLMYGKTPKFGEILRLLRQA